MSANPFSTITLNQPLKDGQLTEIKLRKPMASDLRGLKLLDVIQMDTAAVAQLVPRIAENHFTSADFYQLDPADLLQVMTEIATFFVPTQSATQ
jgi:hypothetical protein